jgi:hypothetical protein
MDEINAWYGDPDANWTLCFQGSGDIVTAAFHSGCDNIAGTVTVVQANGKKFGAYTPLVWNSSGYTTETPHRSFLFSLTTSYKHEHFRYTHDIYANPSYGPTFGGGHDLYVAASESGSYCNVGHNYPCRTGISTGTACYNDFCGGANFSSRQVEVYGLD